MKSLQKTFVYQMLNGSSKSLDKKLLGFKNPTYELDTTNIQIELDTIKRRFNYQMKNQIINFVESKKIVPIYNLDNLNIVDSIPVIGMVKEKKPVIYVNLTGQGRLSKDKIFSIDTRKLFALLQTGYILHQCSLKWTKVTTNATVIKHGSSIYANIFSKVLDKTNAISLNKIRLDQVRYLASKFFLINMMERENNETTNSIAYRNCVNGTTLGTIFDTDINFTDDAYNSLDKFLLNLKTLDGLTDVNIRSYMENFIRMYGSSSVLALEYFPLFCHMIFSSMVNANINNQGIIEPMTAKDTGLMYVELARILD